MRRLGYLFTLALAIALGATTGFAQDGKLKIKVTPKQAYVFVDGKRHPRWKSIHLPEPREAHGGGRELRLQDFDAGREHRSGQVHAARCEARCLRRQCCRSFRRRAVQWRSPRGGALEWHYAGVLRRPRRRIQQRLDLAPEPASATRNTPHHRHARRQDGMVRRRECRGEQEDRRRHEGQQAEDSRLEPRRKDEGPRRASRLASPAPP